MKTCPKCGSTDFYASGKCKPCLQTWRKANPERVKLARVKYVETNKLELNRRALMRYRADPSKRKLAAQKWRDANRDSVRAKVRKWSHENEVHHEYLRREWRKRNPDASRTITQNRRAKLRNSSGTLSKGLAERLFKLQQGKCPCCGEMLANDYHLDHIIPVHLGGEHVDSNIQLLKSGCNLSKGAQHPVDYMQSRGFLL